MAHWQNSHYYSNSLLYVTCTGLIFHFDLPPPLWSKYFYDNAFWYWPISKCIVLTNYFKGGGGVSESAKNEVHTIYYNVLCNGWVRAFSWSCIVSQKDLTAVEIRSFHVYITSEITDTQSYTRKGRTLIQVLSPPNILLLMHIIMHQPRPGAEGLRRI